MWMIHAIFLLALLLLGLLMLLPGKNRAFPSLIQDSMPRFQRSLWAEAKRRFWLALYQFLSSRRVARIWRYCRRHFGFGIDILEGAFLVWNAHVIPA